MRGKRLVAGRSWLAPPPGAQLSAQQVAGHGVATAAVRELGQLAVARYGLRTLRAAATAASAPGEVHLRRSTRL
jgi:hypothetical protein